VAVKVSVELFYANKLFCCWGYCTPKCEHSSLETVYNIHTTQCTFAWCLFYYYLTNQ